MSRYLPDRVDSMAADLLSLMTSCRIEINFLPALILLSCPPFDICAAAISSALINSSLEFFCQRGFARTVGTGYYDKAFGYIFHNFGQIISF